MKKWKKPVTLSVPAHELEIWLDTASSLGERYITRNKHQYLQLLKKALCAGLMMAITTVIKFSLYLFQAPVFVKTLLASLNYSATFLGIYFCHFALGTKQPSLTASALANRLQEDPETIVDEIIHLIRSQLGTIAGNVLGVIPVVALISWISHSLFQHQILGAEKSWHIVKDFSAFGPTPLYAYFTGVLLWLTSVLAGRFEAWLTNRKIPASFRKTAYSVSSNLILGILLAFVPLLCQSLGVNLDTRHVTLSSGSLALAAMNLPGQALLSVDFGLAVVGIAIMAFLNVTVSFGLSLFFAVRKRKVQAPQRNVIYRILLRKILAKPWLLIWPG